MPESASVVHDWRHWQPVKLFASSEVKSPRCLVFPSPNFVDAPGGLVVVRGNESGLTRIATATTEPAPEDRDGLAVSERLATELMPKGYAAPESRSPETAHIVTAKVRKARRRDVLIYGEAAWLNVWIAVAARQPSDAVPTRTAAADTRPGNRLLKANLDRAQLAVASRWTVVAVRLDLTNESKRPPVDRSLVRGSPVRGFGEGQGPPAHSDRTLLWCQRATSRRHRGRAGSRLRAC
jgi:hypothetical protein